MNNYNRSRGLNQDDFAKALSVSRQTISSTETGKYNSSLELAFAISDFFNKRIEEIFIYEIEAKMKKSNLIVGMVYVIFGIVCLEIALRVFMGLYGCGIASGVGMICRYFY